MRKLSAKFALLCATAATPAFAQDAPPAAERPAEATDEQPTDEIIVTALKGNSTAQQAPTTVVVVSGDELREQAVVAVESLQSVVPGIRIQQAPGGTINPVVRGIGTSPSSPSFEQSIGLFVDGIYAGHSREYAGALFDVSRIELLKGTQAAVVGKNTSLGALSLITNKAKLNDFGYDFTYGHEFKFKGDNATGSVNVPIGEDFAVRAAVLYDKTGGYIKNTLTGGREGGVERHGVRAGFHWAPGDRFDWTGYGQYTDYNQTGQYFHAGIDLAGAGLAYARSPAVGDPGYFIAPYTTRSAPRPGLVFRGLSNTGSRNDGVKFNSTMTYDIDWGTITSVTGYGRYDDTFLLDGGGFNGLAITIGGEEFDNTFSQELRLGSNGEGPISYIVGGYYYYDKWKYNTIYDWDQARLPPGGLGGAVDTDYTQRTKTISLFANLGYNISDALKVNGSVRYENFRKSAFYDRSILRPGPLGVVLYPDFAPTRFTGKKNYFDYSGQVQYFITPDKMAYVSYATGTKGFGFHNGPRLPAEGPYKTERSSTFEAGAKIGFGPGSHLNLAYFDTKIDDYQIGVNLGASFLIRNDDVGVRGVEGDLAFAVTPDFNLGATVTYADAKKRGTLPANSIPNLPFSPKWSGLVRASYDTRITDALDASLSGDLEFRSSQQLSDTLTLNSIYPRSPGYAKLNLRAGVEDEDKGIGVALLVRNVTNKYVINYAFPTAFIPRNANIAEDPPRTVMLQFTLKQ